MSVYRLTRVNKSTARKLWEAGENLVIDLNPPKHPIGHTKTEGLPPYYTNKSLEGWSFDELVENTIMWQHRYPGSKGIVWTHVETLDD